MHRLQSRLARCERIDTGVRWRSSIESTYKSLVHLRGVGGLLHDTVDSSPDFESLRVRNLRRVNETGSHRAPLREKRI